MDVFKDGGSSIIVLSDEEVNYKIKGKGKQIVSDDCLDKKTKESFVNSSHCFGMAIGGSTHSVDLIDLEGYSSDCSDEDYDYDDQIYDDLMDGDEYSILEAHFDRVDMPPGIEAPIPFAFPDHTQKKNHPNIGSSSSFSPWSFNPFKWKSTPVNAIYSGNLMSSTQSKGTIPDLGVESTVSGHDVGAMNVANTAHKGTLDCVQQTTRDLKQTEFGGTSTNAFDAGSTRDFEENLRKLAKFKRFDIVEDHSDHYFSSNQYSVRQPLTKWAKRVQEDWCSLQKDLPDTIFVRVYESRMDLLRAAIMGAEGTPYHDGLFFFDVFFPNLYPSVPPLVHYHSGGLRVNPNLYGCGRVCLSLLNTWSGDKIERWTPGVSSMLQVLVSIQGLILNAKPYFNEPGFAHWNGSLQGEVKSREYNEKTFILSLKTMMYTMKRPPKHFEDLVVGHFCKRSHNILVACRAYVDGAQVGCLAEGGVQDVDAGDKSSSKPFKTTLAGFMPKLAKDFVDMGAKECEKFLSSTTNENNLFIPKSGLSFL